MRACVPDINKLAYILNLIQIESATTTSMQNESTKRSARSASSSLDMDALQFRLVQYHTFYNGQIQKDSSECLMVLI